MVMCFTLEIEWINKQGWITNCKTNRYDFAELAMQFNRLEENLK